RVVSDDSEPTRVLPPAVPPAASAAPAASAPSAAPAAVTTAPVEAPPLDQRGTRRAQRYRIAQKIEILVDGNAAALVDLSKVGAQVISVTALKPNQRVRVGITDNNATLRFNASGAWAKFEFPPGWGPRLRGGIEFVDGEASGVEASGVRPGVS